MNQSITPSAKIAHIRCEGNCLTASGLNYFVHTTSNPLPTYEGWQLVCDKEFFHDGNDHWLHPDCVEMYEQWQMETMQ